MDTSAVHERKRGESKLCMGGKRSKAKGVQKGGESVFDVGIVRGLSKWTRTGGPKSAGVHSQRDSATSLTKSTVIHIVDLYSKTWVCAVSTQ